MNSNEVKSRLSGEKAELARLGVVTLKLFGSAARNQAGPGSDLDFLVRFRGPASYDQFMDLKFHLETVLGLNVDLVTEDALRSEMRKAVEGDALLVA